MSGRGSSLLSTLLLGGVSALGLAAFLRPFLHPEGVVPAPPDAARAGEAPVVFLALVGLCLLVTVASLEGRQVHTHTVAVLGVLVAVNAVLRLVTGPAGASAFFFLPILCGYVFGAELGFLLGSLSMLASALLTGGVGPWLPFQMFAAGWGGMLAGWLPSLGRTPRLETAMLALCGALSALLYGVVLNLWFWPYLDPGVADPALSWSPELGPLQGLLRYAAFYLVTSLWWDLGRAVGNVLLLVLLGPPVLRLLRRFRRRFHVELV